MIKIQKLLVKTGDFKIGPVNLHVPRSQCHIIVGPTGSGKSILLETIAGLVTRQRGKIILNGVEVSDFAPEKRLISYVPQDLALFPNYSVWENIRFGLRIQRLNSEKHHRRLELLIDFLNLKHLLDRNIDTLSGGEKQRTALARALAIGSEILLLDEPFNALHEALKKELWYLIRELQRQFALTILMVTHDLEEAFFLGDYIHLLLHGKIHQSGNRHDIYYQPKSQAAAQFLGIRNLFQLHIRQIGKGYFLAYCEDFGENFKVFFMKKENTNEESINEESINEESIKEDIKENIKEKSMKDKSEENKIKPGLTITAGIRSEEVMILRKDKLKTCQENTIRGKVVNIYEKGISHTLLFIPHTGDKKLEIEIPNFAYRKLGIYTNKDVVITLKAENIFYFIDFNETSISY